MSDQCKHCTVRGKIEKCLETNCSQHESWMVLHLAAELTALQSKLSKAEAENEALFEAAVHLNHFVPKWAEDVPEGLCPTMYGTGDYERDLDVKRSVDKSREAIDKAMQNKG